MAVIYPSSQPAPQGRLHENMQAPLTVQNLDITHIPENHDTAASLSLAYIDRLSEPSKDTLQA